MAGSHEEPIARQTFAIDCFFFQEIGNQCCSPTYLFAVLIID